LSNNFIIAVNWRC